MLPHGTIRNSPEDFIVEELPAYPASGEGPHLYVTIRKRERTTLDALKALCRALDADEKGAGFAGMKDRHAITTQTISLPFPLDRSLDEALALSLDGIDILDARRHRNKLKPGHLLGNRFTIVVRDIPSESIEGVIEALERAGQEGVPNAFGPQRFGRAGDNVERALAWLSGKERGPRDRREQRLVFSALQAHLFNEVLARRIELGSWAQPIEGDLLKKSDTGGLFLSTDVEVDRERALRGEVSPTGPIFGAKMRWPEREALAIEREVLESLPDAAEIIEKNRKLGEGSRRVLRLLPDAMRVEKLPEDPHGLRASFVLPKGGYATTVLAQAVALEDKTALKPHAPVRNERASELSGQAPHQKDPAPST